MLLEKLMRSSDCKLTDLTANHSSPKQRAVIRKQVYVVFNFNGENVENLLINSVVKLIVSKERRIADR